MTSEELAEVRRQLRTDRHALIEAIGPTRSKRVTVLTAALQKMLPQPDKQHRIARPGEVGEP